MIPASGGDISGTLPTLTINNSAVTGAKIASNTVTAGNIANRTRRMSFPGSAFTVANSSATFPIGNGLAGTGRQVRVNSFGLAGVSGGMSISFVVPSDYVGPSAADLTSNPGIAVPRLRIKWATNSVQADNDRKINVDISFSQDDQLTTNTLANRFRYNIRRNAGGTDAAESLFPSNATIADQIVPEPGDNWSSGEGALNPWVPGQIIVLTLFRNDGSPDDPNNAQAGVVSVSFEYDADQ